MWRRIPTRVLLGAVVLLPLALAAAFAIAVIVTPLPAPDNPVATQVLDANGQPVATLFTQNRVEIPVVNMPQHLLNAIVAIEDDRFYQHGGLDPYGIARAMVRNLQARRVVEGGSTITQQLAKNLYLSQERTLIRKVREAILTLKLEHAYSKKEILGMYWNTIYLGRGAYGVEVAAQTYFNRSATDLTLAEAAFLASLPRAPEYYSLAKNREAALQRRNLVLTKMADLGFIEPDQAASAKAAPLLAAEGGAPVSEAPYFVDYVAKELRERYPEIADDLHQGGYRIYTTLDLNAQRQAEAAVQAAFPPGSAAQPQAALVAIDPTTGYIRALVGGHNEKRVERNRVLEPQQPGSAFKPFVYSAVLETRKYTAASTKVDEPVEFPGAAPGEVWRPRNYENTYSRKPTGMRQALRKSLNTVTAQWMDTIKPRPVIDMARRMGVTSDFPENLTIGLGTAEVTPLDLTRAYAPLANGGYAVRPLAVLRVLDRNGNVLMEQGPVKERVLDPGIAFIMTDLLKEVLRPGGTGEGASGYLAGRPAAGKSGTTENSWDAWFVGYTPDLVAGVWLGNDTNTPTNLLGGANAAPIWADFMGRALHGKPHRDWAPPDNVVAQEVCSLTALRPNLSCPVVREWFLAGTVPIEIDPTVHWDHLLPSLPGIPWAPQGGLPPSPSPRPGIPAPGAPPTP